MSARVYERKFAWDEARRLSGEGLSDAQIAAQLGVSATAVYRVVKPGARERINAKSMAWKMGGTCPDCGKTGVSRQALDKPHRCVECAQKVQATSVRDSELLCFVCREWKPDSEFPYNRNVRGRPRRYRHTLCRGCQAGARRRARHRRRVPCVSCGQPRSHPDDRGGKGRLHSDTGLCSACSRAGRRKVAA